MSSDDQADEKLLAGVDLHAWRVPPPRAEDRPAILVRALAPAATPKRARTTWIVAGLVLLNALIAAILVIVIPRRSAPVVTTSAPAGSLSDSLREITARLAQSQAELEERLAEVKRLRAEIEQMTEKVRTMEAENDRLRSQLDDKTVPRKAPVPAPPPAPASAPGPSVPVDNSCDEVSCVLQNYPGTCCLKYRKTPPPPVNRSLPEGLDRSAISAGIAQVKGAVEQCGQTHPAAKGKVKVKVTVAPVGRVTNLAVEVAPDVGLARCVADAVQKARFPATQQGGSFSYPFVF